MSIFARPHYMSDATQFLNQLKKEHPELEAQQRAGRALLWDKAVNHTQWKEFDEAQTPRKAYFYQTDPIETAQK